MEPTHHPREVIPWERAPADLPERETARMIREYWAEQGMDVKVYLVRVSYRPRNKTETYYSIMTETVGALPRGYHGQLNRLGAQYGLGR